MKKNGSSAQTHFTNLKMRDYEPLIVQASTKYSVDPDIVRAVIKVESNYNNHAVSPQRGAGINAAHAANGKGIGRCRSF